MFYRNNAYKSAHGGAEMFEASDIVAYGVNSVCTVTEITTKE